MLFESRLRSFQLETRIKIILYFISQIQKAKVCGIIFSKAKLKLMQNFVFVNKFNSSFMYYPLQDLTQVVEGRLD